MSKDEALKMAIDALEMSNELVSHGLIDFEQYNITEDKDIYIKILSAIDACEEALEQPTQEPVLYIDEGGLDGHATWAQATRCQATDIALYTHPKEWQGMSDDEIWNIANFLGKNKEWDYPVMVAKTIEQALKEKNT